MLPLRFLLFQLIFRRHQRFHHSLKLGDVLTGAKNALAQAIKILEKELKLTVNQSKSHIAHREAEVKFLGVEIGSRYTRIQAKKLIGFKQKLRINMKEVRLLGGLLG